MEKGVQYKIIKLEKGPLQRFKNQNLLLKKFGEVGLQVYRAINSKKTTADLQKDLTLEEELFTNIITYMEEAGMVDLVGSGDAKATEEEEPVQKKAKEKAPTKKAKKDEEIELTYFSNTFLTADSKGLYSFFSKWSCPEPSKLTNIQFFLVQLEQSTLL